MFLVIIISEEIFKCFGNWTEYEKVDQKKKYDKISIIN